MVEIELPEDIQQLIQSFDNNCSEVERQAIDTISSFEVPVFNVLRDLTARNCYLVLCHLPKWFGQTPTSEHCTCLMVLTEYVSCSYNNTDFYSTFVKTKQDRFYETFFVKLSNEWKKVFHKLSCKEFTLTQFNSLKKNLKISFSRFPYQFAYKWMLNDIMRACDDYGDKLRESLSKPPLSSAIVEPIDTLNSGNHIEMDQNPKLIGLVAVNSSKTFQKPSVIGKTVAKPAVNPSQSIKLVTNSTVPVLGKPVQKLLPNPGQIVVKPPNVSACTPLNQTTTNSQSEVIVTDDAPTPAKIKCKSFAEEENIPSFTLSKMLAKESEFNRINQVPFKSIENSKSCGGKCAMNQSNVDTRSEAAKPKVLNAFDILMRKHTTKKKNIA